MTGDLDVVDVSAALTDVDHVRQQYASEDNLAKRRSAWVDEGTHPVEPALEAIRHAGPARVLDIGCGQGWLAERIARETGAAVVAADASPQRGIWASCGRSCSDVPTRSTSTARTALPGSNATSTTSSATT